MVQLSPLSRIRAVGVLPEVLQPERQGVPNIPSFEEKTRDIDVLHLIARTFVELGHLLKLLWDRITEGCRNVLAVEDGSGLNRVSYLVSESVIPTII